MFQLADELATENVKPGMESREDNIQTTSQSSHIIHANGVRQDIIKIIRLPPFAISVYMYAENALKRKTTFVRNVTN